MCRRTVFFGVTLFGIGVGLIVSVFFAAGTWRLLLGLTLLFAGYLIGKK